MFFLTEIDPRAAIKGSRDPLGLQPVWTRFGRAVVGNLTTVTTSLRGFTTLLVGFYFVDELINSGRQSEEDRAALFMKFEQLVGYSRFAYGALDAEHGEGLRGITRITERLAESKRVRISADRKHQILSNQKTYGIWGLFTVAGRHSGICDLEENRLTPGATDFVEKHYLPKLSYQGARRGGEVRRFLEEDQYFEPKGRHRRLGRALAEIMGPRLSSEEREFYGQALILGSGASEDPTHGRQAALWRHIDEVNSKGRFSFADPFDHAELVEIFKRARKAKQEDLAARLDEILTLEPLLAAMARLFSLLLQRNTAAVSDVAAELDSAWGPGLTHLQLESVGRLESKMAETIGTDGAARLRRLATHLYDGRFLEAVDLACQHNAAVMKTRGGAPWISIDKGRLNVRLREHGAPLPESSELRSMWTNSYFINALKTVGGLVYGEAR
jgi:hypothetical protein